MSQPGKLALTPISFELACIGRAAVDLYGEQVGCRLEDVTTFAKYLGGSPANTAVGSSRLGIRSAMVTRVGNEQNGNFVRETLAREGVDVSQVSTDPERFTALVFLAIRDHDTFPHIFYRDRCADMALASSHIDPAFIASCGAVLVSGTHLSQDGTLAACERAIAAARDAGAKVILDIDYRPVLWGLAPPGDGAQRYVASQDVTARIAPLLPDCDLIVGTEEEIRIAGGAPEVGLSQTEGTLAALRAIRKASQALIVLKRGAAGCVAFEGEIPASIEAGLVVPGFPVEVFNVLGAGDAFMAGFLRGWLRGEPVETCCRYGNACGALVVSRHGCAPAMPSEAELQHFLSRGVTTPRLREDRELAHVHRATTRAPAPDQLHVLAFDHRSQLEAIARTHGADAARIGSFKSLVADAFERVAAGRTGFGVVLDDRYGEAALPRLTGRGYWIARPVEVPGSNPVAFEADPNLGLALRTWPSEHVAKCLVYFDAADPKEHQDRQLARLSELSAACEATRREMLVEVIAPGNGNPEPLVVAQAMRAIYAAGIRPDWWKLPPSPQAVSWNAIGDAIDENDRLCRGVLVLGMEAGTEALREGFTAAAGNPWVRGFAVGRSIFADAAHDWLSGKANDAQVVAAVAARYEEMITLWEKCA